MSTGVIIALIVIVAAVVLIAAVLMLRTRRGHGGPGLKRRFGPEYDRAVARHDGDAKAAERELTERVERHGSLRERPLEPAQREQYEARWTAAQERFVDSPREAVAEADRLLAELAGARGFPDGGQYEEQLSALSVHHAHHVHGYRRVHQVARTGVRGAGQDGDGRAGTEELREAMVEARALFEELVGPSRHRDDRGHGRERGAESREGADTADTAARTDGDRAPRRDNGRAHLPWGITRRHAKGS
ncbi:secreted protein [Streptomyces lincolnensis]|uniref:Secreted protein n=1 Tax=Streptomyces lincolnensis TaxID=1915 RepID=A0A1B1M8D4_STRLN|nr:hypothetical protein [Streptomyces lincolnensis]ANS64906.1 secreted protein [Streptomyces lincolnensis]AXG56886.1 secreted protein [Streptomyces lincolnensis]QMV06703.1 hypothetical protein GJU35_14125 [Streptomyces lincolnensis]